MGFISTVLLCSCNDRQFRSREDTIAHFNSHRPEFDRARFLFLQLGVPTIEIARGNPPIENTPSLQPELFKLAQDLSVVRIDLVPRKATPDEQYVEFQLPGHSVAPYGLIFVPEAHDRALSALTSEIAPPPRVYLRMVPLAGRWFYYEYQ